MSLAIPAFLRRRRRPKRPLTCADLARQKRWQQSLCCASCHEEGMVFEEVLEFCVRNPLKGQRIRRSVTVCCATHRHVMDWYPDMPQDHRCSIEDIECIEKEGTN